MRDKFTELRSAAPLPVSPVNQPKNLWVRRVGIRWGLLGTIGPQNPLLIMYSQLVGLGV